MVLQSLCMLGDCVAESLQCCFVTVWSGLMLQNLVLQFPELGGGMANHSMQGHFSPGSAPHSPAGPPGLMMAGPMPHPDYMHSAMGAGGQYIPIPMQVIPTSCSHCAQQCLKLRFLCIKWVGVLAAAVKSV